MTRQVGIIKWFGGFDKTKWRENDYGFISCAGKQDLFVHRENVLCSTDDLTEGMPVTFEIGSKSGKMRAIKVNLLQNESNLNILANYFEDDASSSIVAKQYLSQLDNDQAIAAIAVRLQNLSQQEISEWLDIIVPWLDLPQSELLYPLIPLRKRLELYMNRFAQAEPAEQLRLAKKIIAITEHLASAGKNSNILWWRFLLPTQQTFYKKLCPPERNNQRISLPFLYLTLLTDFLERLCNPKIKKAAFSPKEYEILLYADLKRRTRPLGIVDPLDIISNLIDTLDTLWSKGKQSTLRNFRSFKFHGLGLLQAKAEAYEKWTTILAYCGGRIEGIGKCGKRPLIYGRDQTCSTCKRLVCPECGYCQRDCPDYKKRLKDIP